jgi:hypothetical protein
MYDGVVDHAEICLWSLVRWNCNLIFVLQLSSVKVGFSLCMYDLIDCWYYVKSKVLFITLLSNVSQFCSDLTSIIGINSQYYENLILCLVSFPGLHMHNVVWSLSSNEMPRIKLCTWLSSWFQWVKCWFVVLCRWPMWWMCFFGEGAAQQPNNPTTQPTLVHTTLDVDFTLHIADKYLPVLVYPSSIWGVKRAE